MYHQLRVGFSRRLPHFPGSLAATVHVVQHLLIFEGIHAAPEPVVAVGKKLLLLDQSLKRLLNQFFATVHEIENLLSQYEESSIHPDIGAAHMPDLSNEIVIGRN